MEREQPSPTMPGTRTPEGEREALIRRAAEVAERARREEIALERRVKELEAELERLEREEGSPVTPNLIETLSDVEREVVIEEMHAGTPEEFEAKTDPETFVNNEVVKSASGFKISKRMEKIVRKLRLGALMGVGIVAGLWIGKDLKKKETYYVQPSSVEGEVSSISQKEIAEKTPIQIDEVSIDMPTLKELSPNAQSIYLYALTNVDSSYVIVDKPRATMYVIGKDKKLIASFPVLLGKVRGEEPNTANPDDDIAGPGATTPAGRYRIGHDIVPSDSIIYKGKMFSVYDEKKNYQISIHATYPGELETRTGALRTLDIRDNRMTWGCINLDEENFLKYLKGKISENAVLFIIPDDSITILDPRTGKLLRVIK
ncbi:MAG: L,D-transpeptidase [bacterium]|nr:L,D-transpeptidase [bacterium]